MIWLSESNEDLRVDAEKGAIYGLSKGYIELQELLHEKKERLISERQFLLGITIGILGNLVASYVVEFQMLFAEGKTLLGILLGLTASAIAFGFFYYYYTKKSVRPVERKIAEIESVMKDVAKEIDNALNRLTDSKSS